MPGRRSLSRRTAVVGALGGITALVATGCDADDLRPPEDAEPSPSAAPATSEPDSPTPDEALVDEALAQLSTAVAVIVSARRFKTLRAPLGPVFRAHRAHTRALGGEGDVGTPPPPPGSDTLALRDVRRSEVGLQAFLVDAAARAESGALARMLGSMSASVTQHVATLPPPGSEEAQ